MSTDSGHKESFSADAKKQQQKQKRLSEHDIETMVANAAASGNIDMHANADKGESAKWEINLPEQKQGKGGKLKDRVKNLLR